ncbi:MAG TPA: methyltransferase domain-containing protein [Burkholderiaceae bacterium]
MQPVLKLDLAARLRSGEPVVLELGCGPHKTPGRLGIDRIDLPGVDIVTNIDEGLGFLPDGSVDAIYSESFFEHVSNLEHLVSEVVRVLKPNGYNWLFVPHFSNPYYYSDYTHKNFFGLYTLRYFCADEHQLKRKVPNFYSGTRIRVVSQRMIFSSTFKGLRFLKKVFQKLVNLNTWTQEFYEENLCYLVPCYGMEIRFERV